MTNGHDFKKFPELTNSQMQFYYFDSPHKQITEDIRARVVKVSDGDTIRVRWDERSFDFPIRIANLAAPELNERGGRESQAWLKEQLQNQDVDVILSKSRVEKWGRLLAGIVLGGINIAEDSIRNGHAVAWEDRGKTGELPNFNAELDGAMIK